MQLLVADDVVVVRCGVTNISKGGTSSSNRTDRSSSSAVAALNLIVALLLC